MRADVEMCSFKTYFVFGCCLAYCLGTVYRRDHLYGPRYRPLWPKSSKNAFTRNFGKSAIKDLIEGSGFVYENYTVTTEDGFILNLNRMIHPERLGLRDKGYPLLLFNGFNMGSEMWFIQSEMDTNLAAVWGALGYDVWIGDQRGNVRSRGHIKYNASKDKEYWDHSAEEIGGYDYAAFIDVILQETDHRDLVIVCISMGCSYHVALVEAKPQYNQKILGAFYFNPLVNNIKRTLDMPIALQLSFFGGDMLASAYERAGEFVYPKRLTRMRKELYYICRPIFRFIMTIEADCYSVLAWGGTSIKSHRHLLQMYYKGEFSKFNYGREQNLKRYGTEWAPLFDLKKITSFVAVYYSDGDGYTSLEGGKKAIKSLGGPTYECVMPNFNHTDVALSRTFKYIFPDVNQVLDSLVGYSNDNQKKAMSGECPSMEWVRGLYS